MTATLAISDVAPVIDRTGEMLEAILHEANAAGVVHGIRAVDDAVIITAATDGDLQDIACRILNGHHRGDTCGPHAAEGMFSVHDLTRLGEPESTHILHVRIVKDVLS